MDEETSSRNLIDPFDDAAFMHFMKYRRHVPRSSKKQVHSNIFRFGLISVQFGSVLVGLVSVRFNFVLAKRVVSWCIFDDDDDDDDDENE